MLYHCRGQNGRDTDRKLPAQETADVAASFQEAMVDMLVERLIAAARRLNASRISVGGGVAANSRLRARLQQEAGANRLELVLPPLRHCLDNAAMIAGLGYHLHQAGILHDLSLDATPTAGRRCAPD